MPGQPRVGKAEGGYIRRYCWFSWENEDTSLRFSKEPEEWSSLAMVSLLPSKIGAVEGCYDPETLLSACTPCRPLLSHSVLATSF